MTASEAAVRPKSRRRLTGFELGLVICGLVAAALIAVDVDGSARAVFSFATLLLVPGWAIVRLLGFKDLYARIGLTVIAGALVVYFAGLAMVWSDWWHPRVIAVVLLLAAGLSLVLIQDRRESTTADAAVSESTSEGIARHPRRGAIGPAAVIPWVWLVVAIGLWIVALRSTQVGTLGDLGLLAVYPVIWYVALGMVFVLCLCGLTASWVSGGQMAAAVGSLAVILNASANLVEDVPRLPWVYKHIAVTRYIEVFGSVDPSIDIYHRWPGFFSFAAFLGEAIGYPDPVSYAQWAETAFPLINAVLILAIARTISRHRAWYWMAAIVFTICNWVGQSYFAPQAFAFSLYLALTLVVLTYLRAEPRRLGALVERILTRRSLPGSSEPADGRERVAASRGQRAMAIGAVLLLQCAIVASHQLTPYVVALAVLPLFVLGYFRPTWVGFAIFGLAILYLVPNLDYIQQNFGIFSSFDPVANATYSAVDQTLISTASMWQGRAATALTVLTVLLAGAGFVRRLWRGQVRSTLIVAWFAVAPMLTLLGQTYGGEGKFRVFLFGLPFYAMGVAWLCWPGGERRRGSIIASSVVLSVMLALFVVVYNQPEADYRVQRSDVAASEWLDQNLGGSEKVLTAVPSNFPVTVGQNYYRLDTKGGFASLWSYLQYLNIKNPSLADVKAYVANVGQGSSHVYLIFSDSQTQYSADHDLFAPGELQSVEGSIDQDPAFLNVYDSGTVRVYEYQ